MVGWSRTRRPVAGTRRSGSQPRGTKLLVKIRPSWEKAQAEAKLLIGEDGEAALRQMASRLGFGSARILSRSVQPMQ